jgi:lysophospholipase L1-like esterase
MRMITNLLTITLAIQVQVSTNGQLGVGPATYNAVLSEQNTPAPTSKYSTNDGPLVFYAGGDPASWDDDLTAFSGGTTAPGRTFLSTQTNRFSRQTGTITEIRVWWGNVSGSQMAAFVTGESGGSGAWVTNGVTDGITDLSTGTNIIAVSLPVLEGQSLGVYMSNSAASADFTLTRKTLAPHSIWYTNAVPVDGSYPQSLLNSAMNLVGYGPAPVIGYVGDSIIAGHNNGSGNYWSPYLDTAFAPVSGKRESAIPWVAYATNGLNVAYRNYGKGGQTFEWVATNGIIAVTNDRCPVVWVHCGVNDVGQARAWSAVEANLDTIRAAHASPLPLFISEILPCTNADDTEAATIRTWNANLATWCSANGATLAQFHDIFGQTRVSTGQLDDLKAEYDQDGVHLTQAGVNFYASNMVQLLEAVVEEP